MSVSASGAFQHPSLSSGRTFSRRVPKLTAMVDINEEASRDIATMDEWATACGVQRAEGFQLTSDDGLDVSVVTTQDLPAESPVLFVPRDMIFSSRQAQQELGRADAAEDLLRKLNSEELIPHFYLFLKILAEYEKGDEGSPWYPWLNSLPRYYSNGACMTHFCCSECLPPLVGTLAMIERVKFIQFFRALKTVNCLSSWTKHNRNLAKWAFAVLYTRSFEAGEKDPNPKIVPMADMFNHGTQTEIDIRYDEDENCYAYTTCDVPAGSPLRLSYGHPTNPSYFFARYGFLDESSPATFCKIMIPHPTPQLVDMGYDESKMLFYKDTGDVSQEVWDVLLYEILENNPGDQQAFYDAHMRGDDETKGSFHEHYSSETSAALRDHIDTFLQQLDILSGKAAGRDLSVHPRIPLILRHNEFVKNTFLAVRANL